MDGQREYKSCVRRVEDEVRVTYQDIQDIKDDVKLTKDSIELIKENHLPHIYARLGNLEGSFATTQKWVIGTFATLAVTVCATVVLRCLGVL